MGVDNTRGVGESRPYSTSTQDFIYKFSFPWNMFFYYNNYTILIWEITFEILHISSHHTYVGNNFWDFPYLIINTKGKCLRQVSSTSSVPYHRRSVCGLTRWACRRWAWRRSASGSTAAPGDITTISQSSSQIQIITHPVPKIYIRFLISEGKINCYNLLGYITR